MYYIVDETNQIYFAQTEDFFLSIIPNVGLSLSSFSLSLSLSTVYYLIKLLLNGFKLLKDPKRFLVFQCLWFELRPLETEYWPLNA